MFHHQHGQNIAEKNQYHGCALWGLLIYEMFLREQEK
jgi:hypothetical protein